MFLLDPSWVCNGTSQRRSCSLGEEWVSRRRGGDEGRLFGEHQGYLLHRSLTGAREVARHLPERRRCARVLKGAIPGVAGDDEMVGGSSRCDVAEPPLLVEVPSSQHLFSLLARSCCNRGELVAIETEVVGEDLAYLIRIVVHA